jgi:alpha-aminoadipic semialdehyde synthase
MWTGGRQPKLRVIGDISCDINGSVACPVKPPYPDRAVYVYHPNSDKVTDGVAGRDPMIMAVEILQAQSSEP